MTDKDKADTFLEDVEALLSDYELLANPEPLIPRDDPLIKGLAERARDNFDKGISTQYAIRHSVRAPRLPGPEELYDRVYKHIFQKEYQAAKKKREERATEVCQHIEELLVCVRAPLCQESELGSFSQFRHWDARMTFDLYLRAARMRRPDDLERVIRDLELMRAKLIRREKETAKHTPSQEGQGHAGDGDMACVDESVGADLTSEPSASVWQSIEEIEKHIPDIAKSDTNVLLLGETGTGKGYFAKEIHKASLCEGSFITVNCAALSKDLVSAQLFGHTKGAYTGADTKRDGFVRQAKGGTIFLDELGDLAPESQAVVLRFLQEKEVQSVGKDKPDKVDIRIIAATNKHKELRRDIAHRFSEIMWLLPLREQRGEIPELAKQFFEQAKNRTSNKKSLRFTKAERKELAESPFVWGGNTRHLQEAIGAAVSKKVGRYLTAKEVLAVAETMDF